MSNTQSTRKKILPPLSEEELLERCAVFEGLTFGQLSMSLGLEIPINSNQRKGWIGAAIELILGADAKNKSSPDFQCLGIELKTLPIGQTNKPTESTFITSIPLLSIHKEEWATSQCYGKLKRILWIPIEGEREIPYAQRRIGRGFLWSPTDSEESILAGDWNHLSCLIAMGQLETIDARIGEYLQVRPKAAHGKSLCYAYDSEGNRIKTLPRGFYLRSSFTAQIFGNSIKNCT